MSADQTTDADLIDRVARVIAAAIWRPSPDMSGDIWRALSALERRKAEDAAVSALEEVRNG